MAGVHGWPGGRKPLIYAHLADGRDVLVPADYSPTPDSKETKPMTKKTATTKAAKAKTPAKAESKKVAAAPTKTPTKDAVAKARHRYDWKGTAEAAKQGKLPPEPDFSAETHRSYRPKLANVTALAKAGDVKGLLKLIMISAPSPSRAIATTAWPR